MTASSRPLWHRILAGTAAYSIAMLFGRMASFFLLPVYTRYLTPTDYGVLEIADMSIFMLGAIVGLGIGGDALFYFYARLPDEVSKKRAVQTIILAASAIGITGFVIVQAFATPLAHGLFKTDLYTPALRIAAFSLLFAPTIDVLLCYLRAVEKSTAFMFFSLCRLVSSITLNIVLLVVFKLGLYAILVSAFAVNAIMFLGLGIYSLRTLSGWAGADWGILRRVASYSAPIGVASVAMMLIHYADRFFLSQYCSLAEIGVYALAYKLGMALSYLNLPFQMFWRSQVYSIVGERDGEGVYVKVFTYFEFAFIVSAFVLAIFSGLAVRVLAKEPFWGAAVYVPWLVCAYAARALEYQIQSALLLGAKTRKIMYSTLTGVGVCMTGYAFAIPAFGVWGAVLATCLAFATMLVVTFFFARRQMRFQMPYGKLVTLPVLAVGLYLLRPLFGTGDSTSQILISILFCAALPAITFALPGFSEERRLFATISKHLAARITR